MAGADIAPPGNSRMQEPPAILRHSALKALTTPSASGFPRALRRYRCIPEPEITRRVQLRDAIRPSCCVLIAVQSVILSIARKRRRKAKALRQEMQPRSPCRCRACCTWRLGEADTFLGTASFLAAQRPWTWIEASYALWHQHKHGMPGLGTNAEYCSVSK